MRKDPTGRALQLLSLLQTHRWWRGAELAERLEITERSVRRDVDRLRELGYPVDATSGKHGGYRLATGAHLPPLVLDDDEAVAVAVGLRYAAEAAIGGMEEASLRALTTIEQLLPHRLRRRVSALRSSVASMRSPAEDDVVDPEALSVLAAACRDREDVRFDYRRRDGTASRRLVQPHQLVTAGRRWYLVAWDQGRDDWRTFRLDRLREPRPAGSHFAPRQIPGGDAASFVASSLGSLFRQHRATLVIGAPFDELEGALRWVDHTPVETEADSCVVQIRSEDLEWLAVIVARIALTGPVSVVEPAELADTVLRLASNLARAPAPGSPAPPAGPGRPGSAPSS
ncbi:YafY family transcriptional regulator [Cellulomonas humilata]|uniref:YafY family transcriptional regulator n=1 Tax=Cellulomonas humilata TaxID=144055 RepID=A0A7Y6DZ18_9CELL|nr:YafY family protein [Cellulomonas humilata]NUU19223.1 YafY family transcriptional regulator [Cellulomonas humilata]